MAGVFDLELHDTPEGDEEISDDEFFEPELEVWCKTGVFHISSSSVTNIYPSFTLLSIPRINMLNLFGYLNVFFI